MRNIFTKNNSFAAKTSNSRTAFLASKLVRAAGSIREPREEWRKCFELGIYWSSFSRELIVKFFAESCAKFSSKSNVESVRESRSIHSLELPERHLNIACLEETQRDLSVKSISKVNQQTNTRDVWQLQSWSHDFRAFNWALPENVDAACCVCFMASDEIESPIKQARPPAQTHLRTRLGSKDVSREEERQNITLG